MSDTHNNTLPLLSSMISSECVKPNSNKLKNIDENDSTSPADWLPSSVRPPKTPTESMEFLARSWSLSATELAKALSSTNPPPSVCNILNQGSAVASLDDRADGDALNHTLHSQDAAAQRPPSRESSPNSSDGSHEEAAAKELFTLHQALHPDLLYTQQILKNGIYKPILKGKTTTAITTTTAGRWSSKEHKEKKKHEIRTHNAQLHAAVSVAGVAAAIAAITASTVTESTAASTHLPPQVRKTSRTSHRMEYYSKMPTAIASAAALVASHCIEIAEEMGADHRQVLTAVGSAVNARSNGDVMALTAGAATALRGVATLKARLRNGYGGCEGTIASITDKDGKDLSITAALNFISAGGELLKRTRKGDLHWKQVSFRMSSTFQVVIKMKSKHVAGTFTKKRKFLVSGLYSDIPAWPEREWEEYNKQPTYFGVQTGDRVIEFECKNKLEKKMWTDGIQHMLNHCMSDLL